MNADFQTDRAFLTSHAALEACDMTSSINGCDFLFPEGTNASGVAIC